MSRISLGMKKERRERSIKTVGKCVYCCVCVCVPSHRVGSVWHLYAYVYVYMYMREKEIPNIWTDETRLMSYSLGWCVSLFGTYLP